MVIRQFDEEFWYKGKCYKIGDRIIGTSESEYEGHFGSIFEIRDGEDKETENDTPDIYCDFEAPDDPEEIKHLEDVFSDLYACPKSLDEICLDIVIMAPEMIRVVQTEAELKGKV
jgi:hypothetical protein